MAKASPGRDRSSGPWHTQGMQALILRSSLLLAALASAVACDPGDDADETAQTETGGEMITNACGTFDPNEPGDSVIPQDPDDPEIIAACTSLCDAAAAGIMGCTTSAEACLEQCKMRSCGFCPDTLVPLVECETTMFVSDGCTCDADGIDCPAPAGCSDLEDQTTACGG
jgi:hypothetical protein